MNEAFEKFYSEHFRDRWPAIRAALAVKERQVARACFSAAPVSGAVDPLWLPDCVWAEGGSVPDAVGGIYLMDPASVVVARALEVREGERILDLCAAPGGKGLILAEGIGDTGSLILNEPSTPRRMRLMQVVRDHVPREVRSRVEVRGKDGLRYGIQSPESFDGVLVDAPCSGERHLLANDRIAEWSEPRSRRLAKKQFGLLASAALAVRPGGRLLYSTCSLSPFENDAVVGKLLKRRAEQWASDPIGPLPLDAFEPTEFGWQCLPDRCGFGPMYFARLRRR